MMWEEYLKSEGEIVFPSKFHTIPCQKCGVSFGNHSSSSEIFGNNSDGCGGFVEDEFGDYVKEMRKNALAFY